MTSVSSIEEENPKPKAVGTKLTPRENEEIQNLIDAGIYLSFSDFIREAIRDKLKAIKVIKIREIDYDTAKKEILGYYKNYSESYDYEVADDLELDYEFVCQVLNELEQEGRLGLVE
ncbi:MAG: hypothetical protein A4E25_00613 [Methanobacterium sp. PtaB.Bin024]|jgi:hypothetical protein|nr:MAG: hypothetical protein A4E25_00613 [Methanobacterium sp. PtaB.Bin024]